MIEYSKNLEKKLESVLPGTTWLEWKQKYEEPKQRKADGRVRALVGQIASYLSIMADQENLEPITPQMVKEALRYAGTKDTFRRAVNTFLVEHLEWTRIGYSFVLVKKAA